VEAAEEEVPVLGQPRPQPGVVRGGGQRGGVLQRAERSAEA
jgi:hypothetical protein